MPGITDFGNLSRTAVFIPELTLITSTMLCGSRPAFVPITITSEASAMLAAESRLLQSFMVWPMPGFSPMKNGLPTTDSASLSRSKSAFGPAYITATVPFSAPLTPPLTGRSMPVMPFAASASETLIAMRAPVVDMSRKRFTFLPSITPSLPVATALTMSGVGRLAITVSTRSATSLGDVAATAPMLVRRDIICPLVS